MKIPERVLNFAKYESTSEPFMFGLNDIERLRNDAIDAIKRYKVARDSNNEMLKEKEEIKNWLKSIGY